MLQVYELMNQGKMNGYLARASTPCGRAQQGQAERRVRQAEVPGHHGPLVTETSEFWRNAGEANDVDPSKIQTEVFRLPTTCFAEEDARW